MFNLQNKLFSISLFRGSLDFLQKKFLTSTTDFLSTSGCIRRTSDSITEDYDEIDRKDPPIFINNTRIKVVVAAGKTATLECRVQNLGDRTVRLFFCIFTASKNKQLLSLTNSLFC